MFRTFLLMLALLLPATTYAISVNKMLLVADSNGRSVITISNPDERVAYIKMRVFEVITINGEAKKLEYTESNFSDWKIRLSTYKTILEPGRTKDISVDGLCGKECNYAQDISFFVYIEPYIPVEKRSESGVVINYGYAPIVIIPAINSNYKFEVKNKSKSIVISNTGNKVINFEINHCKKDLKAEGCSFSTLVLPGRVRNLPLTGAFQDKELKVTAFGLDDIYKSEGNYKALK